MQKTERILFSSFWNRRSRGDYSTVFTETEASDCFSIIAQVLLNSFVNSVKKESMHIYCYNSVDYSYQDKQAV